MRNRAFPTRQATILACIKLDSSNHLLIKLDHDNDYLNGSKKAFLLAITLKTLQQRAIAYHLQEEEDKK